MLSALFRRVKIEFSESSFQELQKIMWSKIGQHTLYILYEVPDILDRCTAHSLLSRLNIYLG